MSDILIAAFGLVLVFEGLVFALAPSRLEDLIAAMSKITVDQRRTFGLIAVALGLRIVGLVL